MKDVPDKYEFKKFYPVGREWINKGNSCIVRPAGNFVTEPVKEKKTIVISKINLEENSTSKRIFNVVGHYSRPDVFNFFVNR